jgi:NTE family protein
MFFGDLQEFLVMPAVSPYDNVFAEAAADQLRRLLRRHVDFERLETEPGDQNPPVRELVDLVPDEIWVIQINPTRRDSEPRAVLDIADRRNELAGNLSLYQELHFSEKIDELLEDGVLAADCDYKSIMVRIIELSPSRVRRPLGARTKLNREPEFLRALIAHGRQQATDFLTALDSSGRGPVGGVDAVAEFIAEHLHGLRIDATPSRLRVTP